MMNLSKVHSDETVCISSLIFFAFFPDEILNDIILFESFQFFTYHLNCYFLRKRETGKFGLK